MQWQKNLIVLSIATFISSVSFTLTTPFIPMYLQQLGLRENLSMWSGFMSAISFFTYGLMSPVWGSLADRHGKRVMLARSGFGISLIYVLMGLSANHWQLFLFRALNGVFAGFNPTAIVLIASNTPEEKMSYALGTINTSMAVGTIMGPFLGGAAVRYMGIRTVMFVAAAILCVSAVIAVLGTKEKIVKQKEKTSLFNDIKLITKDKNLQVYFLCIIILQATNFMIQPILPLRIAELVSVNVEFMTGLVFSILGISLAIGSSLISRVKEGNHARILFIGLLTCGIFYILQGFAHTVILLIIVRFIYGFAHAAVNVSGNVLIAQNSKEEMKGRVYGVLNSLMAIGYVVGPLLGGFMGDHLGNASPFFGGAVLFFMVCLIFWKKAKRQTV